MSPRTMPRTGRVEVVVDASADQVWAVLSDVRRVGEWSHEASGAHWLDGASGPAVGVRFRGRNKAGPWRWTRPCTVTDCDPLREFGFRTRGRWLEDATQWRVRLEPAGERLRIVESFEIISLPRWAEVAI